ncbi:hypothetical protein HK097_004689 [Rhizophlyctis rosea]|uniref:Uncharacterized protein n=1 Tax=Rhizophlyctis rosea TaxID=64517 RepID=A0AAD5SHA5_9FUNG|nr:hypothetical protein HK097_004689 [Rhizophlyctis rosea]
MPVLRSCCGCISLRNGALIISSFLLFSNILSLLGSSITSAFIDNGKHDIPLLPAPGLFTFVDTIIIVIGLAGILKNRIKSVKIFAVYNWIRVGFSALLSAAVMLIASIGKDGFIKMCEETNRDLPSDERIDCQSVITVVVIVLIVSFFVNAVVSIYFGFAIWSYYQDLRDHPENYFRDPYVYLAVPVGGEAVPSAPFALGDDESRLPAYDEGYSEAVPYPGASASTEQSSATGMPTGIPGLPDAPAPAKK